MRKVLILMILLTGVLQINAQNNFGELHGKVFDENGDPMIGANVYVEAGDRQIGAMTDENGKYKIKPLQAGIYTLNISFIGYQKIIIPGVNVKPDQITFVQDSELEVWSEIMPETIIVEYEHKRIDPEETGKISVSAEALKNSPAQKDIKTFVASMSSDIKTDSEGQLYFRGGRPTSIVYFVDGIKISGNFQTLPSSGVGSISVYTGGIPAKYGDTTSGVIVIESKNYFDLYNQWLYN